MKNSDSSRVVILGAGNVAASLAPAIEASGAGRVVQVYSRDIANARSLAERLDAAEAIDSPEAVDTGADICLVTLADDAVVPVISRIGCNDALWLHTSGSLPMSVLEPLSDRYGVFYPLQTFSKSRPVSLDSVSLFIEGSDAEVEQQLCRFGEPMFRNIFHADSLTRRRMHVAAVFACNFSNYMWMIADELLHEADIPFDVLAPLLHETLDKALSLSPRQGQTGPARRADRHIIDAHARSLPEPLGQLYNLLSERIINEFYDSRDSLKSTPAADRDV